MHDKLYTGMFIAALACAMPARVEAVTCHQVNLESWEQGMCQDAQDYGMCAEFDEPRYYKDGYTSSATCFIVSDCAVCEDGAEMVEVEYSACPGVTYRTCQEACAKCDRPCKPTAWETIGNYRRRYTTYCDCGTCTPNYSDPTYQCVSGYYGTGTNCTQCPEATDVFTNSARTIRARGTSHAGATTVNGCYLGPGTYYTVEGTFTGTSCTYNNQVLDDGEDE